MPDTPDEPCPEPQRPFTLRVLIALTELLETVSREGEGPYGYDLSGKVFRGRTEFGDDDPMPLVAILERWDEDDPMPTSRDNRAAVYDWPLIVQGFCRDDPENPTDPAHFLLADIKRVLSAERLNDDILNMKRRVTDIVIGRGTRRPADEISSWSYFWLPVTLRVVERQGEDFA